MLLRQQLADGAGGGVAVAQQGASVLWPGPAPRPLNTQRWVWGLP